MKKMVSLMLAIMLCLTCLLPVFAEEAAPEREVIDVTLYVAAKSDHGDWNEYWCMDLIEKELGINFIVTQVSEEGWEEKESIAFATETLPDVFLNNLSDADLANYGGQGYLLPLEEYITPEKMPNFFDVVNNEGYPDLVSSMTFPDGHIYSFRGVNGSTREYALSRYFINVKWAENLGVKVPETLDEFYNYLVAVRDGDADLDGDPNNEIPMSGRYGNGTDEYTDHLIPILVAFGFLDRRLQPGEDGKVQYVPVQPNYKEFLKFMNKLYTEKLLDQTYFTQTAEQFNAKEASCLIGSLTNHAQWMNNSDPAFYTQYESVDPYTSEFNTEKMWPAKDAIFYGGLVLTSNLKDKPEVIDRLIEFADWCYSEEGTAQLWYGFPLGSNEEYPDCGYYYLPASLEEPLYLIRKTKFPAEYASNTKFQNAKILPGNNFFPYATIASRTANPNPTGTSYNLTTNIVTHMAPYYKVGIPATMKYTPEEVDDMSLIETDLNNWIATMESKMIKGDLDIDATWDEFVKGCEDRGLEDYLKVVQTAYDRYVAANAK